MNKLEQKWQELAELAIENGECAAQVEIKDTELRDSLIRNVKVQLQPAYEMNS